MINGVEVRPLFRGKMENGEWLVSDCIMQFEAHPVSKQAEIHLWHKKYGWMKIDRDTFGVSIGSEDKNGKKIFSDDLLKGKNSNSDEETLVRILLDKYGLSYWINQSRFINSVADCDEGLAFDEFEVIGNIHDNKDLWQAPEDCWWEPEGEKK